ncbi:Signal transduction histidine kinase [Cohaesibacter sp. ES.047]|uniref:ATP-binding protein n=1 Tax=Cohaesibacter sp. ES.047 TaxID=1798205 RepID=UPI000BB91758|nr:ATP-binding protein [Cohaesibacter sp. ES.047]SNY92500.1 Signal transduction histidine kinase [Cohaesibacter sp. ES.047]
MTFSRRQVLLFCNSIASQLLMLLVIALFLLMGGFYVAVTMVTESHIAPPVRAFTEKELVFGQMLAMQEKADRPSYIQNFKQYHPEIEFQIEDDSFELSEHMLTDYQQFIDDHGLDHRLSLYLPSRINQLPFALHVEETKANWALVSIHMQMPDKQVITAKTRMMINAPPKWTFMLALVLVCMVLLLIWAIVFLIRPIRRLSAITDRIAFDGADPQPVDVGGPTELRVAAQALSKMQDRIRGLLDDRTRMLVAVSHDLRTPVTRLRLRADMVEQEEVKAGLLRDIAMMDGLLSRLMIYFRSGSRNEEETIFDFCSLIETLTSEWEDAGHDVTLVQCDTLKLRARPTDILRLTENLIDNAIKYAGSCEVSLVREADAACLRIVDHGAGIAEDARALLLEPFTRGEDARTMDDKSGFGLGLAIARKIAQSHRATIELAETSGGGLTVLVRFPLSQQGNHSDQAASSG